MAQRQSWEKAPRHLQDRTHEDGGFDDLAVKEQARNGGRKRGEALKDDAVDRQRDLRLRYPNQWGKRGTSKIIARREANAGRPISERHVRRLMTYRSEK